MKSASQLGRMAVRASLALIMIAAFAAAPLIANAAGCDQRLPAPEAPQKDAHIISLNAFYPGLGSSASDDQPAEILTDKGLERDPRDTTKPCILPIT